ncbi:hypothetical protein BOH72_26320 [Mycobacterium sp. WY10]|nr:hypothetical protein BOH72_26320 [Mycobacterium sp. WY10]
MTTTPSTRIDHTTLHAVNDYDAAETYQVNILHMADGRVIGYRIDTDDGTQTFTPAQDGVVQALGT